MKKGTDKMSHDYLVLIGVFDFAERIINIDLNNISEEDYQNIYYMYCRDLETGEIVSFFTEKSTFTNEVKEVIKTYYCQNRLIVHPEGDFFSLKDFKEISHIYNEMKKNNIEPTLDEIWQQVYHVSVNRNKVLTKKK